MLACALSQSGLKAQLGDKDQPADLKLTILTALFTLVPPGLGTDHAVESARSIRARGRSGSNSLGVTLFEREMGAGYPRVADAGTCPAARRTAAAAAGEHVHVS